MGRVSVAVKKFTSLCWGALPAGLAKLSSGKRLLSVGHTSVRHGASRRSLSRVNNGFE